eukprot:gene5142-10278_t
MPRSICSAPGKVILFGEHAVVFGVTAIAAALSDLRIVVQLDTIEQSHIEVNLHDLLAKDTGISDSRAPHKISHSVIQKRIPKRAEPLVPICPSEEVLKDLHEEFSSLPLPLAQGLMAVSFLTANIMPELMWGADACRGVRVDVRAAGLPISAGLGSSASFSVALAGALLRLRQLMFGDLCSIDVTLEELAGDGSAEGWSPPLGVLNILNGWAYASEVVIHGEPSGLDNTTACFGGAVRLNRTLGRFETLPALPDIHILITNTKVPRSTKEQVGKVRALHESMPTVVQPILESIEGISQVFLGLLDPDLAHSAGVLAPSKGNDSSSAKYPDQFTKVMGSLFNVNHNLLCALGVGHSALTMVKEASMSLGLACKLTGAGGGGCAMTLLDSKNDSKVGELRSNLSGYGYETFCSKLGGLGVKWHSLYPKPPVKDQYEVMTTSSGNRSDVKTPKTTDVSSTGTSMSSDSRTLSKESHRRNDKESSSYVMMSTIISVISVVAAVSGVGVASGNVEMITLALAGCLERLKCCQNAEYIQEDTGRAAKLGKLITSIVIKFSSSSCSYWIKKALNFHFFCIYAFIVGNRLLNDNQQLKGPAFSRSLSHIRLLMSIGRVDSGESAFDKELSTVLIQVVWGSIFDAEILTQHQDIKTGYKLRPFQCYNGGNYDVHSCIVSGRHQKTFNFVQHLCCPSYAAANAIIDAIITVDRHLLLLSFNIMVLGQNLSFIYFH